jgi:SAM-dependent methyltransferase
MITPRQLKSLYEQGRNISAFLREAQGTSGNTEAIIEVSYDLQTGSYIAALEKPAMARHKEEYTAELARVIRGLTDPESILEAGVGEATTFAGVLAKLGRPALQAYGFDLSWSRVAYARRLLEARGVAKAVLCTGSLLQMPFADCSVDVVYTSHSIEPNGGRERPILEELYRVARRYLILLEPGYELAGAEARARMESHGYCRRLRDTCEELGYRVLEHRLFPFSANPLNPTALTIVEKGADERVGHVLACPRLKTPLLELGGALFSPEALCVYPVIAGIPCLRTENAIVASKFEEILGLDLGGAGQF